ncbi:MAG: DUF4097 family beta strand repeat-containing protein [Lachnospiraceae bacterium]|nr:DUF4097 family beta strand repeat-containing protein [Lachnospiraceae bacterium]MDD3615324.1 DUF4097 family beta strand repeat-containing protein [Lachnospiraceae bacterium]
MKNKKTKILLIAALCCIAVGACFTLIGMLMGGKPGFYADLKGVHDAESYRSDTVHTLEKMKIEDFDDVEISIDYADVEIIPSDDYYLEYQIQSSNEIEYSVKDNKLTVGEKEGRGKFFFFNFTFFGFSTDTVEDAVKVYVPKEEQLENVNLKTESGTIRLNDSLQIENLKLKNEYGDVKIDTLTAQNLEVKLESGDFTGKSIASDKMTLRNEYGGIKIDEMKSENAEFKIESGDLALDKAQLGDLSIDCEYGNAVLGLAEQLNQYALDLENEYGDIKLPDGNKVGDGQEGSYHTTEGSLGTLKIRCESGDVEITENK